MSYIKLEAHYIDQTPSAFVSGAVQLSIALNDGTAVDFPAPFVPLTNTLAVMPMILPDGDAGLRIDFTLWAPLRYGPSGPSVRFPLSLSSQDLAVRVTRAFDADPSTAWSDSPDQMITWLRSWVAANNVPLTV
jgi:hypothetical protein